MIKVNSRWYPKAPNHNQYTDRPSVKYAYYATINYLFGGPLYKYYKIVVQGFHKPTWNEPAFLICEFLFSLNGGIFGFWSGLQGPNAYSLWYGVVPKPSIGEGYL